MILVTEETNIDSLFHSAIFFIRSKKSPESPQKESSQLRNCVATQPGNISIVSKMHSNWDIDVFSTKAESVHLSEPIDLTWFKIWRLDLFSDRIAK